MDNKKKTTVEKKVNSRNRKKNKNKTLQTKVKERERAKKEKTKKTQKASLNVEVEAVKKVFVSPKDDVVVEEVLDSVEDDVIVEEVLDSSTDEIEEVLASVDDDMVEELDEVPVRDDVVVVPNRIIAEELEVEKEEFVDVHDEDDDIDTDFVKISVDKFRFVDDVDGDDVGFDKFRFVKSDVEDEPVELEEFHGYEETGSKELVSDVENRILEPVRVETVEFPKEELVPTPTDNVDVNAKKYISFETRVIVLLVFIVISFFIAGILIFKAVTHTETDAVTYLENSSAEYNVCISKTEYNQYYDNACLEENMEYLTNITERLPITFRYNVDFSESISTKLSYYVVSKVNIYREKNGKVLNSTEDVLVERTDYDVFGESAKFMIDVEVPFKKYNDYVGDYNTQYGLSSYATLDIAFYVDNGSLIKKVSSLEMPLSDTTFSIEKAIVRNEKQNLTVPDNNWGSINTSYAVVGVIFVFFGLIGIIRLANLVCKITGTTSLYQRKLNKILREYDRQIVISRGDYSIDESKKLIKVSTFGELLDARDTLEKPIVYVKVNNVKSDFYVEDSEIIYKYTMKEADFEGK